MVFLPGDHTLDRNITVANVARLTMRGEYSSDNIATVVRNGSVGFSFTNIVDFNIYFLAFTSYNRSWSYGSYPASNSALILRSTQNAELVNCSFHDNIGIALAVDNTSVTLVENKFIHNQCACGSFSEMHELGCGITTFNSYLTFTGNTSFHNSIQTAFHPLVNCAGAIWALASSLHFTGTNNFIGNSANGINGVGAIYAEASTLLSFIHNSADVGGAIGTTEKVAFYFNGTTVFFNNSASDSGGAIFAGSNTFLSFIGTNQFSHNSAQGYGGVIAAAYDVVLTFNGTNNNSAEEYGGAIDTLDNAVFSFNGTNNFMNNSANNGGAIYAVTNISLIFIGTNNFTHNSAGIDGGAVLIAYNGVLTFNGTNNFFNNSANNGSAIYAVTDISLIFIGTNNFTHNSAGIDGGAVLIADNGVLTFNGTNNFFNNSANNGGAIYAVTNISLIFIGTNNFTHNSAGIDGGAVLIAYNGVLTFNGTNNFFNNSANNGSAIYAVTDISLIFIGTNNFTHNSAGIDGGAVLIADNGVLTFNGTNNFFNNSANNGGAIYAVTDISLIFNGTNNFTHNSASIDGGAVLTADNGVLTFNGANNFINNSANNGGAIYVANNISVIFIGANNFTHNSAGIKGGGVVIAYNGVLTFNGTNNFNYSANSGGAIFAVTNTTLIFIGANNFTHNSVSIEGGGVVTANNGIITFNGTNNFFNNSANNDGAIYAVTNISVIFFGANNFTHNSAGIKGGAVVTAYNGVLTFSGTNNFFNNSANTGSAIYAVTNISLIFNGTNNFTHNSVGIDGGAVLIADNGVLIFNGTNNFFNNSANNGGAIFAVLNASSCFNGTSSFSSNSAMQGGAISANSYNTLTFNGNISFTNNGHYIRDSHGGAMHLAIDSTFFVLPHTNVYWENNYANLGGAIYVLTANPFISCKMTQIATFIPREKCFFQLPSQNLSSGLDVQFIFKNNSADAAGSVLYGGAIDNCCLDPYDFCDSGPAFDKLIQYEADNTASSISSDPFRICLCNLNNRPNCSQSMQTLSVYPGETFKVSAVAVGQRNGIVPSAVRSHTDKGRLASSQYIQQTTKMCTTLNYTVFSQEDVSLELYPDGPCSTVSAKLFLKLSISQSCPPGFSLENSSMSCVCDQTLQKYTNNCNITNGLGRITRESDDTFWAGYDGTLTVHPQCPIDNCVSHAVNFPLNNTDMQCAYNRSGMLCGACKDEYSLVLGTSHCKQCTNYHLYLVIPFALMGVALVFLLLACKLTVATGTLSGLVLLETIVPFFYLWNHYQSSLHG